MMRDLQSNITSCTPVVSNSLNTYDGRVTEQYNTPVVPNSLNTYDERLTEQYNILYPCSI